MILLELICQFPNAPLKRLVKLALYRIEEKQKELSYKVFMSDIAAGIIKAFGADLHSSWYETISSAKISQPQPEKSPEQIKQSIIAKFKGLVG